MSTLFIKQEVVYCYFFFNSLETKIWMKKRNFFFQYFRGEKQTFSKVLRTNKHFQ